MSASWTVASRPLGAPGVAVLLESVVSDPPATAGTGSPLATPKDWLGPLPVCSVVNSVWPGVNLPASPMSPGCDAPESGVLTELFEPAQDAAKPAARNAKSFRDERIVGLRSGQASKARAAHLTRDKWGLGGPDPQKTGTQPARPIENSRTSRHGRRGPAG